MPALLIFGISVAFSFVAWSAVTALYIWPALQSRSRVEALRMLLVLHTVRFEGLSFLVPGIVAPDLPIAFAHDAAYGDLTAAILALLALASLRSAWGVAVVWLFNIWGSIDLLNAFYQANNAGLVPGQLGAAFFIPTLIVPLLLITHGLMFAILLDRPSVRAPA